MLYNNFIVTLIVNIVTINYKKYVDFTLASSGVLKLIIFPNSLAWNTDLTRS